MRLSIGEWIDDDEVGCGDVYAYVETEPGEDGGTHVSARYSYVLGSALRAQLDPAQNEHSTGMRAEFDTEGEPDEEELARLAADAMPELPDWARQDLADDSAAVAVLDECDGDADEARARRAFDDLGLGSGKDCERVLAYMRDNGWLKEGGR